jgi:type VI protein secretion system component Hcp
MTKQQDGKASFETATTELNEAELEKAIGGSTSSGSGAGKVTFNPFSITRKIDSASPSLFT